MTNPLTSELIWKQFEKVTQYAHKNYGWDKWDLAQVMDTGSGVAMVGMGTYSIAAGIIGFAEGKPNSTALLGTGAFFSALGFSIPYLYRKINDAEKYLEMNEIFRTDACKFPYFGPERPLALLMFSYVMGKGIVEGFAAENNFELASALVLFTGAAGMMCYLAQNYFRSQLPTPPSTKKPFWKTTYEGIKDKFQPKPQLEPAAEPAPQCTTIDTLV